MNKPNVFKRLQRWVFGSPKLKIASEPAHGETRYIPPPPVDSPVVVEPGEIAVADRRSDAPSFRRRYQTGNKNKDRALLKKLLKRRAAAKAAKLARKIHRCTSKS